MKEDETKRKRLESESQISQISQLSNLSNTSGCTSTTVEFDLDGGGSEQSISPIETGNSPSYGTARSTDQRTIKKATKNRKRLFAQTSYDNNRKFTFQSSTQRQNNRKTNRSSDNVFVNNAQEQSKWRQDPHAQLPPNFQCRPCRPLSRQRRFTEGEVDTPYYQAQIMPNFHHSTTVPNFGSRENLETRPRYRQNVQEMIDRHDAHYQGLGQRRSTSVTSLRGDNHIHNVPLPVIPQGNQYQAEQNQHLLYQRGTIVDERGNTALSDHYISPVHDRNQLRSHSMSDIIDRVQVNNEYLSFPVDQNSGSGYEHIEGAKKTTPRRKTMSFKRGFFCLLVLNSLLILAMIICFTLFFVNTREPRPFCVSCSLVEERDVQDSDYVKEGNQCCFKSNDHLFQAMHQIQYVQERQIGTAQKAFLESGLQTTASSKSTVSSGDKIVWDPGHHLNINFGVKFIKNDTGLKVLKPGYYFIFTQVVFEEPSSSNMHSWIFHQSLKDEDDDTISETFERCFSSKTNDTGKVYHSSTLQVVRFFNAGSSVTLSVSSLHEIKYDQTRLGMFKIQ